MRSTCSSESRTILILSSSGGGRGPRTQAVSVNASDAESTSCAVAGKGSTFFASESTRGDVATVATMRPFHVSKPLIVASSAPQGPRRRNRVPVGNGVRASTASLYAASRAGSRRTSASTRPMSTSMRFPRAAARNQLWVTGGNTSFSAIVSASGGRVFGLARAAGRIRRAVEESALSMEPRRLPIPTLSAVSFWGLGTGDWGLGWSTVESVRFGYASRGSSRWLPPRARCTQPERRKRSVSRANVRHDGRHRACDA